MCKQENANGEGRSSSSSWGHRWGSSREPGDSLATGTWAQRPGYCLVPLTAPGRTVSKQLALNKCSLLSFMSKQCSIEKALNWEAEAEELSNFNLSRLRFES